MFPLNQNDPESLRYRILARNAINPTSSALKLAKINKEYRFVNGSDQDPPIFADINKTNGNEKRSLGRSLKAYRNSTEHESSGIKRFKNGKRIRYYPLQQQDDLRDGLVKRSSYLHTEGLPIFTEEEYESQFVPVAGKKRLFVSLLNSLGFLIFFSSESTEDDDPAEVGLAEDEHTMQRAPPPRNRDRMGNQSSSRNQQASSASCSNDSRQARHSSTNHSNNIQPTYRSRDDRSSSPEAERSGYFENEDPSDFLVNKRLGQKVVVDGTPVDFEVEMHLDEDGLFHSGDPWNIVGCYSPRGIETEAGLSVPTLVVIFPNRPLVHDWSMSSTTHTAKITESRDGMIVHLTPGAKDPCMSSLMHQVGRILSTKFSGRVSASTIECLETASESFAAAASEENKNKMTSIHVRFPFRVLPRIHQDAATSDRSLNSLTHHPVFLGNGTAGAPKCLQDSKGRSVNYTKKAAVFTIAVDCKPTKRAKTKAGALSRSEIELLEINEQLAAASLGYGSKSICRNPLLMIIIQLTFFEIKMMMRSKHLLVLLVAVPSGHIHWAVERTVSVMVRI